MFSLYRKDYRPIYHTRVYLNCPLYVSKLCLNTRHITIQARLVILSGARNLVVASARVCLIVLLLLAKCS